MCVATRVAPRTCRIAAQVTEFVRMLRESEHGDGAITIEERKEVSEFVHSPEYRCMCGPMHVELRPLPRRAPFKPMCAAI